MRRRNRYISQYYTRNPVKVLHPYTGDTHGIETKDIPRIVELLRNSGYSIIAPGEPKPDNRIPITKILYGWNAVGSRYKPEWLDATGASIQVPQNSIFIVCTPTSPIVDVAIFYSKSGFTSEVLEEGQIYSINRTSLNVGRNFFLEFLTTGQKIFLTLFEPASSITDGYEQLTTLQFNRDYYKFELFGEE